MDGVGNGIVVAVETLQDDLDVVDVLRRAAMEAAWSSRCRCASPW
jgi:hypothetical protein